MIRNQHRGIHLAALLCLLTALYGCATSYAPESRDYPYKQPGLTTPKPPKETDTERSAVNRAVEWIANQRYQAALELLEPLRRPANADEPTAGRDEQQAEVLFWIAYCHEKQGRPDEAQPLYQHVRDTFTDTRFAPVAQARLEVLAEQ